MATISHLDIVDANFMRMAQDWARRNGGADAQISYEALAKRLAEVRETYGLEKSDSSVAVMALDFNSEKQQDWLVKGVEKAGFRVWPVDQRHSYASPTVFAEGSDKVPSSAQSLSPWVTYLLGIAASSSENRSVVVVSGAFEIAGAMTDFVNRKNGGKAVLAFFQPFLNKRWLENGLFDERLPFEFFNLGRFDDVLGVDLRKLKRGDSALGTTAPI